MSGGAFSEDHARVRADETEQEKGQHEARGNHSAIKEEQVNAGVRRKEMFKLFNNPAASPSLSERGAAGEANSHPWSTWPKVPALLANARR